MARSHFSLSYHTWIVVVALLKLLISNVYSEPINGTYHRMTNPITNGVVKHRSTLDAALGTTLETTEQTGPYTVSLYGSIFDYAYYFADIFVGAPNPQRVSVIVDTGSSLLAFACTTCPTCGSHIDTLFDVEKSDTATWMKCDGKCKCDYSTGICKYHVAYEEGSSISGQMFRDYISLGGEPMTSRPRENSGGNSGMMEDVVSDDDNVVDNIIDEIMIQKEQPRRLSTPSVVGYAGCHKRETNLFVSQEASGVMGIALRKSRDQPTIMEAIFANENIDKNMFSMCLSHYGGVMTVGGDEVHDEIEIKKTSQNDAASVTTPLIHGEYYSIEIQQFSMGNDVLGDVIEMQDNAGAMVDSGTTYTHVPPRVWKRFQNSLESHCNEPGACKGMRNFEYGEYCWILDNEDDLNTFPTLHVDLRGGASLEWHPTSYMYPAGQDSKKWCVGIRDNNSDTTVLGMSFFINKNIGFDLDTRNLVIHDAICPTRIRPNKSVNTITTAQKKIDDDEHDDELEHQLQHELEHFNAIDYHEEDKYPSLTDQHNNKSDNIIIPITSNGGDGVHATKRL